jgi:nucleoside-diphosphate-sugar epimerase
VNKKKLLFTGGTGFLGKNMMAILEKQFDVTTCGITLGNIIKTNLSKEVPTLIQHYDIVLHAAGKAHSVPKNITEEQVFFDINLHGTINLCAALEKSGVPTSLIFISSVSVYGLDHGVLINENHSLLAKDSYGLSKIKAESFIQNWCKQHNVICAILRLPLVVGANPPGNLGAMIKGIEKGCYFNIAGGKARKSMVLASDVARSILKVAEIGGIYNLTDGYHPSFEELSNNISIQLGKGKPMLMPMWLARLIANFGNLLGSKAPLNTYKLKKITSDLTFDNSKAREAFGWDPAPVLDGFNIN